MKHKILIRRRDGIRQHYIVGRKNYGSALFRKQIQERVNIESPPSEKRHIIRIFEKNPELLKEAEGITSIGSTILPYGYVKFKKEYKPVGVSGIYDSKSKKITLSKTSLTPTKIRLPKRNIFDIFKKYGEEMLLAEGGPSKTLRHELGHHKYLSSHPDNKHQYEKAIINGHLTSEYLNDPNERFAREYAEIIPLRKTAQYPERKELAEIGFKKLFGDE